MTVPSDATRIGCSLTEYPELFENVMVIGAVVSRPAVLICKGVNAVGDVVESAVIASAAFTVNPAEPLPDPPAPEHVSVYVSVAAALGVTVLVPLVPSAPLQAPLAVHEVAFVEDQVNVAL